MLHFIECLDDGLLLCNLVNSAVPNTIDFKKLNVKDKLNVYQKTENAQKFIVGAKSIGCQVVNMRAQDIVEGNKVLVYGIIWQVMKIQLLSPISIFSYPLLGVLRDDGESLQVFSRSYPDALLLKWLNFILKAAGSRRICSDFSKDLSVCFLFNRFFVNYWRCDA